MRFEELEVAEQRALSFAGEDDVVSVQYAVYQYLGEAGDVDLRHTDFLDSTLWTKQPPHFVTTGDTQIETVIAGNLIQVSIPRNEAGEPQFGVYRYVGQGSETIDLALQDGWPSPTGPLGRVR